MRRMNSFERDKKRLLQKKKTEKIREEATYISEVLAGFKRVTKELTALYPPEYPDDQDDRPYPEEEEAEVDVRSPPHVRTANPPEPRDEDNPDDSAEGLHFADLLNMADVLKKHRNLKERVAQRKLEFGNEDSLADGAGSDVEQAAEQLADEDTISNGSRNDVLDTHFDMRGFDVKAWYAGVMKILDHLQLDKEMKLMTILGESTKRREESMVEVMKEIDMQEIAIDAMTDEIEHSEQRIREDAQFVEFSLFQVLDNFQMSMRAFAHKSKEKMEAKKRARKKGFSFDNMKSYTWKRTGMDQLEPMAEETIEEEVKEVSPEMKPQAVSLMSVIGRQQQSISDLQVRQNMLLDTIAVHSAAGEYLSAEQGGRQQQPPSKAVETLLFKILAESESAGGASTPIDESRLMVLGGGATEESGTSPNAKARKTTSSREGSSSATSMENPKQKGVDDEHAMRAEVDYLRKLVMGLEVAMLEPREFQALPRRKGKAHLSGGRRLTASFSDHAEESPSIEPQSPTGRRLPRSSPTGERNRARQVAHGSEGVKAEALRASLATKKDVVEKLQSAHAEFFEACKQGQAIAQWMDLLIDNVEDILGIRSGKGKEGEMPRPATSEKEGRDIFMDACLVGVDVEAAVEAWKEYRGNLAAGVDLARQISHRQADSKNSGGEDGLRDGDDDDIGLSMQQQLHRRRSGYQRTQPQETVADRVVTEEELEQHDQEVGRRRNEMAKIFSRKSRPKKREHRTAAAERKPTAGEHPPTAGEHPPTAGEHPQTVGEQGPSVGEHRPTAGEHQPTAGKHGSTAAEYHPKTVDQAVAEAVVATRRTGSKDILTMPPSEEVNKSSRQEAVMEKEKKRSFVSETLASAPATTIAEEVQDVRTKRRDSTGNSIVLKSAKNRVAGSLEIKAPQKETYSSNASHESHGQGRNDSKESGEERISFTPKSSSDEDGAQDQYAYEEEENKRRLIKQLEEGKGKQMREELVTHRRRLQDALRKLEDGAEVDPKTLASLLDFKLTALAFVGDGTGGNRPGDERRTSCKDAAKVEKKPGIPKRKRGGRRSSNEAGMKQPTPKGGKQMVIGKQMRELLNVQSQVVHIEEWMQECRALIIQLKAHGILTDAHKEWLRIHFIEGGTSENLHVRAAKEQIVVLRKEEREVRKLVKREREEFRKRVQENQAAAEAEEEAMQARRRTGLFRSSTANQFLVNNGPEALSELQAINLFGGDGQDPQALQKFSLVVPGGWNSSLPGGPALSPSLKACLTILRQRNASILGSSPSPDSSPKRNLMEAAIPGSRWGKFSNAVKAVKIINRMGRRLSVEGEVVRPSAEGEAPRSGSKSTEAAPALSPLSRFTVVREKLANILAMRRDSSDNVNSSLTSLAESQAQPSRRPSEFRPSIVWSDLGAAEPAAVPPQTEDEAEEPSVAAPKVESLSWMRSPVSTSRVAQAFMQQRAAHDERTKARMEFERHSVHAQPQAESLTQPEGSSSRLAQEATIHTTQPPSSAPVGMPRPLEDSSDKPPGASPRRRLIVEEAKQGVVHVTELSPPCGSAHARFQPPSVPHGTWQGASPPKAMHEDRVGRKGPIEGKPAFSVHVTDLSAPCGFAHSRFPPPIVPQRTRRLASPPRAADEARPEVVVHITELSPPCGSAPSRIPPPKVPQGTWRGSSPPRAVDEAKLESALHIAELSVPMGCRLVEFSAPRALHGTRRAVSPRESLEEAMSESAGASRLLVVPGTRLAASPDEAYAEGSRCRDPRISRMGSKAFPPPPRDMEADVSMRTGFGIRSQSSSRAASHEAAVSMRTGFGIKSQSSSRAASHEVFVPDLRPCVEIHVAPRAGGGSDPAGAVAAKLQMLSVEDTASEREDASQDKQKSDAEARVASWREALRRTEKSEG